MPTLSLNTVKTMNPHDTRKIVVVEDHQLVGEFYPHIFKEFQTSFPFPLEVVAMLRTEKEAVDFVEKNSEIDLLLMDLYLSQNEHVDGPEGLRIARKLLKEVNPALNIMFVTQSVEGCWIYQAYNLGVKGYIAKHSPAEELVQAIVTVLSGGLYYRGKVRDKMDDYRAI
ncbi:MAG: DNA-binding response regulator, partial [Bacteroidetes bacterium]